MADSENLTGVWYGLYTYVTIADHPESHFVATLLDFGGGLSGTIHEGMRQRNGTVNPANAQVTGRREGYAVSFLKSYDGTSGKTHQVHYIGALNGGGTEIEGQWTIYSLLWGVQKGRFLMIRDAGPNAAVHAEAFEKA